VKRRFGKAFGKAVAKHAILSMIGGPVATVISIATAVKACADAVGAVHAAGGVATAAAPEVIVTIIENC
jgi:hypothetical protein